MIRIKKIVLLGLLVCSSQLFSQKICDSYDEGNVEEIDKTEETSQEEKTNKKGKIIKTETITITITKLRVDTCKTKYSPEIKEMQLQSKLLLEELLKKNEEYLEYNKKIETLEKRRNSLQGKINTLKSYKTNSTNKINSLESEITNLKTGINTLKNKEKDNVTTEIKFIIKRKSNSYSNKILLIIKERAEDNEVDPTLIAVLKSYISIRKELVESRDLLNKPYNKINIDKILIELEDIPFNTKFSGLIKEKDEIVDLLYSYKEKCTQLFNKLKYLEDYRANPKNIKIELDTEFQKDYEDYPYLSGIIEKNLKVANYKSLIFCK